MNATQHTFCRLVVYECRITCSGYCTIRLIKQPNYRLCSLIIALRSPRYRSPASVIAMSLDINWLRGSLSAALSVFVNFTGSVQAVWNSFFLFCFTTLLIHNSLFLKIHSRLKTCLFSQIPPSPVVSLILPELPLRTIVRTVSSELLGFCF